MIRELIKLATHLDGKGLSKEADYLDSIIKSSQMSDDTAYQYPSPTHKPKEWALGRVRQELNQAAIGDGWNLTEWEASGIDIRKLKSTLESLIYRDWTTAIQAAIEESSS